MTHREDRAQRRPYEPSPYAPQQHPPAQHYPRQEGAGQHYPQHERAGQAGPSRPVQFMPGQQQYLAPGQPPYGQPPLRPAEPPIYAEEQAGPGVAVWSALIIIVTFVIASVVWLGVTTSEETTQQAHERQQREGVQTPPPAPDVPEDQAAGRMVKVPTLALWAPGTKIQSTSQYPQPGEPFMTQACTVAFSFSSDDGRNFAVTAGHCGREGDLVWPTNAETLSDYSVEAGHYIYSGLYSEGAENIDVGIIEITDPDRYMDLVGKAIPTGVFGGGLDPQQPICKTGGTTGYTCGEFEATGRVQIIRTDNNEERETYGDVGNVCALPGDSGGPVFYELDGRATIIGVVSGTEAGRAEEPCDTPGAETKMMSYSNYDQIMRVIERVVPNASWEEQAW